MPEEREAIIFDGFGTFSRNIEIRSAGCRDVQVHFAGEDRGIFVKQESRGGSAAEIEKIRERIVRDADPNLSAAGGKRGLSGSVDRPVSRIDRRIREAHPRFVRFPADREAPFFVAQRDRHVSS